MVPFEVPIATIAKSKKKKIIIYVYVSFGNEIRFGLFYETPALLPLTRVWPNCRADKL